MSFNSTSDNSNYRVAALYKFVTLDNYPRLQQPLLQVCKQNDVMGTILLAQEGINGTISGPEKGIDSVLSWLASHPEFDQLDVKFSRADEPPFYRMKVRLKKEIVTLGVDDVDAANNAGTYVDPSDWNDLISQPDVVVVDTRNDYEVAIGTFKNAQNPNTSSFRELPAWVDDVLEAKPDTKVAMFCTGGIRCEKSTALLKSRGFNDVYHLKGGILKYLETVPEEKSLWEGDCFVFDQRVSVKHGLEVGDYDMCHACRMPISESEMADDRYVKGVSCPHCHETQNTRQQARFQERQKQMDLAKQRNELHIAADIASAKSQKLAEKDLQRERSKAAKS
ncbi:MAG: rhodanese-related sulfurtransferase [Rhizobiaceae bacterium]|nr:rhodanese-related sulfurtransferase [Rhizobiaceae bacterium]